jgi:hypothetical protein
VVLVYDAACVCVFEVEREMERTSVKAKTDSNLANVEERTNAGVTGHLTQTA